jgi:hypothetical protein
MKNLMTFLTLCLLNSGVFGLSPKLQAPSPHTALPAKLYSIAEEQNAQKQYALYLGTSDGQHAPTWQWFDSLVIGASMADNGVHDLSNPQNPPTLWIGGLDNPQPDGTGAQFHLLAWHPFAPNEAHHWLTISTPNCNTSSITYAQSTLFVVCDDVHIAGTETIYINAFNVYAQTWGGWQSIGGYTYSAAAVYLRSQDTPQISTDGSTVFITSMLASYTTPSSDLPNPGLVWMTHFKIGPATIISPWTAVQTSCIQAPTHQALGSALFLLVCSTNSWPFIGGWWRYYRTDTSHYNTIWYPLTYPSPGNGAAFQSISLAVDPTKTTKYLGFTGYVAGSFDGQMLVYGSYQSLITPNADNSWTPIDDTSTSTIYIPGKVEIDLFV